MNVNVDGNKKTLSLGKKILFSVLAIIVVGIAAIASIMLTDERETELAQQWFNVEDAETIDPENNMFFHILGFPVPEEMNSIEQASLWVESEIVRIEAIENSENSIAAQTLSKIPHSKIFKEIPELKIPGVKFSELDALLSQSEEIYDIFNRSQFFKERYSKIADLKESRCLLPNSSHANLHYALPLLRYHKMLSSYTIFEYQKGNISTAIDQLTESIAVGRNFSAQSNIPINKLTTGQMLENSLSNCLDILLDLEKSPSQELITFIESIDLLSIQERSHRKGLYNESLSALNSIAYKGRGSKKVLRQPNASRNLLAETFSKNADLSEISAVDFAASSARVVETNFSDILRSPRAALWTTYVYSNYMEMGHHINGKILLIKAKAEILAKNISKDQVSQFLENNKNIYYNIYTNEPLIWDNSTNELSFYKPGETESIFSRSVIINI
jgi:hypothetical protein